MFIKPFASFDPEECVRTMAAVGGAPVLDFISAEDCRALLAEAQKGPLIKGKEYYEDSGVRQNLWRRTDDTTAIFEELMSRVGTFLDSQFRRCEIYPFRNRTVL